MYSDAFLFLLSFIYFFRVFHCERINKKDDMLYTDFINGGRTVKNWYLVMKTRRFRINNFRVTSDLGEFVRFL